MAKKFILALVILVIAAAVLMFNFIHEDSIDIYIDGENVSVHSNVILNFNQHEMNAEDLSEYKEILQYAIDHGVIAYSKEIHEFWVENLLKEFAEKLKGTIENNECMMLDTDTEKDVLETVNELLAEMGVKCIKR